MPKKVAYFRGDNLSKLYLPRGTAFEVSCRSAECRSEKENKNLKIHVKSKKKVFKVQSNNKTHIVTKLLLLGMV